MCETKRSRGLHAAKGSNDTERDLKGISHHLQVRGDRQLAVQSAITCRCEVTSSSQSNLATGESAAASLWMREPIQEPWQRVMERDEV